MRPEVSSRMRLVACALAGAALIFFAFSSENSDGIELLREFRGQVDSSFVR